MTNETLAAEVAELRKEVTEVSKELALVKGTIESHLKVADVIDTNVGKTVSELKLKVDEITIKQSKLITQVILLETGRKTRKEVFTTIAAWIGILAIIITAVVGAIKFLSP